MNREMPHIVIVCGLITLLLFAIGLVGNTAEQMPGEVRVETLSLGIVSEKPREKIKKHHGFVNYLAQKLSSTYEIKGRVIVARTAQHLVKLINEKEVDFYMESPYPTFLINEQTGGKILLRRWKKGVSEYRSLIFTRRDNRITRLEDLLGKIIVFEDPGSTSGYFLPKAFLLKMGFRLTESSSLLQAHVSSKEIGYIFAHGNEENVINWVLLRKVAAGAISNNDLEEIDEQKKSEIFIIAETETVPRHILSFRKDLDPAVVNRLKEILLSMHQDKEGRKVLKKSDKTSKFDLLPGGEEIMYHKIRELFHFLHRK